MMIEESVIEYMSRKLNSKTIAKWINGTKFFQALLNMIPNFQYLVYWGDILNKLQENEELYIVLDAPASGHGLAMFESIKQFRKIFKVGALVKDIDKMLRKTLDENLLNIFAVSIPTLLAMEENEELIASLHKFGFEEVISLINYSYSNTTVIKDSTEELPPFLKLKLKDEEHVIKKYNNESLPVFPFIQGETFSEIITNASELWPSQVAQ